MKKESQDLLKLGEWAEFQASKIMAQNGYEVLARNYHSRFGEIDLIALMDQTLIFVEVKARAKTSHALAIETITISKQKKIYKTAMIFLQQNPEYEALYYRFDVFCFDFHKKIAKNLQQNFSELSYDLEWIENAFTLNEELINL